MIPLLESDEYVRKPQPFMTKNNKLVAKAYIMGRYGMLKCAANFSNGYGGKNCNKCKVLDDETHRVNHCLEWKDTNLVNSDESIDYSLIYAEDDEQSMKVVECIMALWDLGKIENF